YQNRMDGLPCERPDIMQTRAQIIWMWFFGESVRRISWATGVSQTTVYRWIRRWQREGHVNTRPRTGRPHKTHNINLNK
ncbi:hypothetical protein SK128_021679, partial [Halocaridina rubra]